VVIKQHDAALFQQRSPHVLPTQIATIIEWLEQYSVQAIIAFEGFQGCGHYFCFMCTFIWANEVVLAPHFDMFMSITLLQIVLLGLEGLYILCMDGCGN
jgi:hypothetical protein